MTHSPPRLIGIAGPSASGKSTLAAGLANRLGPGVLRFPVDAFYRDLGHLAPAERADQNFDHPDAIEWPYLLEVLNALRRGEAVEAPSYEFEAHTRAGRMVHLAPAPVIVLEGLLVLAQEAVRDLLDARIYLDCPREVCLARRIARDQAERGRPEAAVRAQFEAQVWPMAEQFVLPSRAHAGLVLDGTRPVEVLVDQAAAWLA